MSHCLRCKSDWESSTRQLCWANLWREVINALGRIIRCGDVLYGTNKSISPQFWLNQEWEWNSTWAFSEFPNQSHPHCKWRCCRQTAALTSWTWGPEQEGVRTGEWKCCSLRGPKNQDSIWCSTFGPATALPMHFGAWKLCIKEPGGGCCLCEGQR